MKREEAEKLTAELILQARICQLKPDNFSKLEAARKAVEDALCADHSGEATEMMSLEEFMVQVAQVLSGKAPAKELEIIYDRMTHSADATILLSRCKELEELLRDASSTLEDAASELSGFSRGLCNRSIDKIQDALKEGK